MMIRDKNLEQKKIVVELGLDMKLFFQLYLLQLE